MSDSYRLFIATELSQPVKQALVAVQARLRVSQPPVKWVAPEAMHLTLQFLGETDAALLPQITAALGEACRGQQAHTLQLGSAGAFPNARRPSVLWVGVAGATEALEHLQAAVALALEPLGFARERRPFRAHLTLGRVRREATATEQQQLAAALGDLPPPEPLTWRVDRVVLFQSELLRGGPRYTARETITLDG